MDLLDYEAEEEASIWWEPRPVREVQTLYNKETELEATVVHVKIEKDDDDEAGAKASEAVLKKVKEEKPDKASTGTADKADVEGLPVPTRHPPPLPPAASTPARPPATIAPLSPPTLWVRHGEEEQQGGQTEEPERAEESRSHKSDNEPAALSRDPTNGKDPPPTESKSTQDKSDDKEGEAEKKKKGEDSSDNSSSEDSSSDSSSDSSDSGSSDSESSSSSSGSSSGSSSDSESDSSSTTSSGSDTESDRERRKRK
ncbi:suppressor protein SRP40-like, partial [Penaeus japonicus]|uniref:suppressor protein SRP40-like n=1 Tax=Penaeus japonicus TaxID=27405 RepID=UPI001C70FDC1